MSAKETIKRIVDSFNSKPQLKDKTREMGQGLMLGASLADDANELSKDVQAQVDQLVIEGDSSVEAAQARVDGNGKSYTTLKKRLDEKEQETTAQFAQTAQKSALALERARIDQLSTLSEGSTTGDAELMDGRIGADGVVYPSFGTAVRKQVGYLSSSLKDLGIYGKNVILNGDFDTTSKWDAVTASNGTLTATNNELEYKVVTPVASSRIQQSDYTPLVGHKYYVRGDINPKYNRTSYISFGGVNVSINPIANAWNKIQGLVSPINTTPFKFYHPTDAPYLSGGTFKFRKILVIDLTDTFGAGNEPELSVLEYYLSKFNDNWFEEGAFLTPSESLVDSIKLELEKESIRVVDVGGNGDYTKLSLALEEASLNASFDNPYLIKVNEGTFDMIADYTKAQIDNTSFKGYTISDYVSLVGTGKKENTIIKAEIPSDWSIDTILRVAPIANMGNGNLMNLTVIGKNCRYTVHDDYAYPNAKKLTKNCTFLKKAGLGNSQAWGEGTGSGMEFVFEDVEFITEYNQASYSTHNNINHSKKTKHNFKNCSFKNAGGYFGVRFITLNSGQIEDVLMENCYIDGIIKFEEYEPGVGCRYDFKKVASTEVPILIDATDGSQPVYTVIEETKIMKNAESTTIKKGTPVKLNNDGSIIQPLGSSYISLLFGIALEDIAVNETGVIKTGGYLPVSDTSLTLVTGDLVGIVEGKLAKVTTGDYIGVVTRSGFIHLKF